jgi:hypothetical protein
VIPFRRPAGEELRPAGAPTSVRNESGIESALGLPAVAPVLIGDLERIDWPRKNSLVFAGSLSLEQLTLHALLAVLEAGPEAPRKDAVRCAVLLVRQPSLLPALLSPNDAVRWRKAVGAEAADQQGDVAALIPAEEAAWGKALQTLKGKVLADGTEDRWTVLDRAFVQSHANAALVGRARIVLQAIDHVKLEHVSPAVERYRSEVRRGR